MLANLRFCRNINENKPDIGYGIFPQFGCTDRIFMKVVTQM